MITKIEVRNDLSEKLELFIDQVSQGMIIENIEGLDPVKATLISSKIPNLPGEKFQNSKKQPRNIKISLDLEPNYAIETVNDVRERLYRYFLPEDRVRLLIYMSDGLVLQTIGYVESFEAPLFTSKPNAVASIVFFDPTLYKQFSTPVNGNTVSTTTTFPIDYLGNVEVGMYIDLLVNRPLTNFTIYNTRAGVLQSMNFTGNLVAGDVLAISTKPGERYVLKINAGIETDLLYAITPDSTWLQLKKGTNRFRIFATGAAIPYNINYYEGYGGV